MAEIKNIWVQTCPVGGDGVGKEFEVIGNRIITSQVCHGPHHPPKSTMTLPEAVFFAANLMPHYTVPVKKG